MAGEYLKSSVHVHSKLCDGKNTLDDIAVTAWRTGLQTLGFSGHSHTPHDLEYCMTQSRTALYKAQVAKLKERYAGKLDILCGLEWDLYSDDDPTQYDYWIGSAHYVHGPKTGKYYEIDWREEDLRACIDDDLTVMRWPWWRLTLPTWPRLPRRSRPFWAILTSSRRLTGTASSLTRPPRATQPLPILP